MRLFVRALCALLCAALVWSVGVVAPERALAFPENPMPYWIHVSRANQIVTVLRTGTDEVVRQMICSTGLPGSPTIKGRFKLPNARSDERKNWYAFSSATWAHYATRITGSYLFHSILYSSAATSSLKRSTWNLLGSRASHGCVRMTPLDAQWIAYNCAPGTEVVINDSKPYGPIKSASTIKKTLPSPRGNGELPGFEPTLSPTPKPGPAEVPTLSLGIEGPRTKAMQTILRSLGYFGGSVNGKFGENTKTALERFQQRHLALHPTDALAANGIATPAWQTVIKENQASVAHASTFRTLKQGTTGLSVRLLRERLKALHYTGANPSSTFDARTKSAVGNAQRALGLKVNGMADQELQDLLLADGAKPLPVAVANLKSGLTLRKSQSTRSASVVKVKNGARLAVVRFYGDWTYVTTGRQNGYVISRYLQYEDPAEDPANQP